MFKKILSSCVF